MKSFEEIAIELLKVHVQLQTSKNDSDTAPCYNPDFDYEVNGICSMTATVVNVANQLAENHRARMITYDSENFDRAVEKALDINSEEAE